jgi:RNA polymerase sigma-70 factor (ECF subfamily)
LPRTNGARVAGPRVRPRGPIQNAACLEAKHLSDQELLDGIRQASEPHFNEFYSRYFQRIYNFVYARVRNHADCEEIVQETFTAVYRSVERYRGQSSLLSWTYGIAKNTLNNHLRRAKAQDARLERAEPELTRPTSALANYTPEEHLHYQRFTELIQERLGSVAEWQAEIFVMRHMDNLSIEEISKRTDRSSDAIRSSLYRVKRLLVEAADPLAPARA